MRFTFSPRNSRDVNFALLIAISVVFSSAGVAQVSPPLDADVAGVEAPAETHFWLRVTGDRVNIRSRADVNSRIVGRASVGDLVEGTAEEYGWYRIVPPPDVFSLVASEYIDRVAGAGGVVNVDTSLRVRVGSDIQARDPELSEVQTRLQPGDEVEIVGQINDQWLKIRPPAGVYVFIWGEFTERLSDEEAARLRAKQPTVKPAETAKEPEPTAPPTADTTPPIAEKPATQPSPRPADVATASPKSVSEPVQAPPASQPAPAADAVGSRQTALVPKVAIKPVSPKATKIESIPKRPFDARGIIKPSFAIEPGEYGLRYTLSDSATKEQRAYIEIPPELGFDAPKSIGKYVGVHGVWTDDTTSGVKVLRATHVAVLKIDRP
jgi:hypothetical protein